MRSMSLVVELIDLVKKHKSGELRCPATALIVNHEESFITSGPDLTSIYTAGNQTN